MKHCDDDCPCRNRERRLAVNIKTAQRLLAQADGLWEYWRHRDFSDSDDHWAEFTNAVYAHLERKPVPERFIMREPKRPAKRTRKTGSAGKQA